MQSNVEKAAIRALAEKIATELFTGGNDKKSDRLELKEKRDGKELSMGGWCYDAAVRVVESVLSAKEQSHAE